MLKILKRRPIGMDGYLVNFTPWRAPSPDLFRSLQYMKLCVRLELVPEDLRTPTFASGFLGLIGAVEDVGMFSSPDLPGYFLRGLVRLDMLRPFFGRRLARDETAPLDLEERGPWMSLPNGSYRRVNAFTLQLDPPRRNPHHSEERRSSPASSGGRSLLQGALLPPPALPIRSRRDALRSDASTAHHSPRSQARSARDSAPDVARFLNVAGKRFMTPAPSRHGKEPKPQGLSPPAPASPDSAWSSTASVPPGFLRGEGSLIPSGLSPNDLGQEAVRAIAVCTRSMG
ncbi:hypothetical protein LINGRAHAP2_LOCUS1946 [Linum grandiflorum]